MAAHPGVSSDRVRWALVGRLSASGLLLLLAPVTVIVAIVRVARLDSAGTDFRYAYLPAANAVLHGRSPYGLSPLAGELAYVYPPLTAFLIAPFTLVGTQAAVVAALGLALAAPVVTLRLLRVEDWRCYLIVYLWAPFLQALQACNVILLVLVGLAATWRYRDRPWVAGVVVGLVTTLKLFAWPLILFLLVTRRWRAAGIAVASAAVSCFVPWAAIGFRGLGGYPDLLQQLQLLERDNSFTVAAFFSRFSSWWTGQSVAYAIAALIVVWTLRHRHDDRAVFVAMVGISLLLSPLVWLEYFVLLAPVIALRSPRINAAWLAPILLFFGAQIHHRPNWQNALALLIVAASLVHAAVGLPLGRGRQSAIADRFSNSFVRHQTRRLCNLRTLPTGRLGKG
jgi:alpha-1,2-mannosyltransferase